MRIKTLTMRGPCPYPAPMTKRRRPVRQPLRKTHPPELRAKARRLYETTRTPVATIIAMLGIHVTAFYRRVKRWGWRRRRDNPRLQPPFSVSRTRRLQTSVPPVPETAPASCGASPADIIARLDAMAERHADCIAKVHRRFHARGGKRLMRQETGYARLTASIAHSRSLLAEIS